VAGAVRRALRSGPDSAPTWKRAGVAGPRRRLDALKSGIPEDKAVIITLRIRFDLAPGSRTKG